MALAASSISCNSFFYLFAIKFQGCRRQRQAKPQENVKKKGAEPVVLKRQKWYVGQICLKKTAKILTIHFSSSLQFGFHCKTRFWDCVLSSVTLNDINNIFVMDLLHSFLQIIFGHDNLSLRCHCGWVMSRLCAEEGGGRRAVKFYHLVFHSGGGSASGKATMFTTVRCKCRTCKLYHLQNRRASHGNWLCEILKWWRDPKIPHLCKPTQFCLYRRSCKVPPPPNWQILINNSDTSCKNQCVSIFLGN